MEKKSIFIAYATLLIGCGTNTADDDQEIEARQSAIVTDNVITGDSLPPNTLSFTYDDGPDDQTVTLAQYLRDQGIRATFFINGCRLVGNPTPIAETNCETAGHVSPSVLTTLTSLGHRIANHTEDHPGLTNIEGDVSKVVSQLTLTQGIVDPYVLDGYFLFRPPYGAWDSAVAADVRTNSTLNKLTGPILWDITGADIEPNYGGDWICMQHQISLGQSLADALDTCGQYVLDSINARPNHNGVILFHDREEFAPGTNYALDLTAWIVEHLDRNVYTFVPLDAIPNLPGTANAAAPTSWTTHFSDGEGWGASRSLYGTIRFADLNNDGRADVCGRFNDGVYCATSNGSQFTNWRRWSTALSGATWDPVQYSTTMMLGDVSGDNRADLCFRGAAGVRCALSNGSSFGTPTLWTPNGQYGDGEGWGADVGYYGTLRLGDVNHDGKADLCGRGIAGIYCSISNGTTGFQPYTGWKTDDFGDAQGWLPEKFSTTMQLTDVNGDGFADVCARGGASNGIACALSNGSTFGALNWTNFMYTDTDHWGDTRARYGAIRFGRLDAGAVRDVCGRNATGIVCALGTGSGTFSKYRYLNNVDFRDNQSWDQDKYAITIGMADVNNDGKADICGRGINGIVCSLTP